jgi:hypothetical protein
MYSLFLRWKNPPKLATKSRDGTSATSTNMNKLPQEIVDRICSYLDHNSLKSVLLISPNFQLAAELYSGGFQKFRLTTENIDKFISIYSSPHFRYLRYLEFRTVIPLPDRDNGPPYGWDEETNRHRESQEDLDRVDQTYTQQIHLLFAALRTVETYKYNKTVKGRIHLKLFTPVSLVNRDWPLQWSVISWRVHLVAPETLPTVTSVHEMTLQNPRETWRSDKLLVILRKLDPRVIFDLSARLPNLSTLNCNIGRDGHLRNRFTCEELRYLTQDWLGPLRDSRNDFIKPLKNTALQNLRHARLNFLYPCNHIERFDQRAPMPNMTAPLLYDPFSDCLRILSQQLRTMHLCVIADETLFWPSDSSTPSWPNLEHLHVKFFIATPSGSWYFNGPDETDFGGVDVGYTKTETEMYPPLVNTEKDDMIWEKTRRLGLHKYRTPIFQYRVIPNDETLVPFLTAFAKAVTHMPRLRTYALWSYISFSIRSDRTYQEAQFTTISGSFNHESFERLDWGVVCAGAFWLGAICNDGICWHPNPKQSFTGQRQIHWRTGIWRPPKDLHELFRKIGAEQPGGSLLESFHEYGPCDHHNIFVDHSTEYFTDT